MTTFEPSRRAETFSQACVRLAASFNAQARIARARHGEDCELAFGYDECARQLDELNLAWRQQDQTTTSDGAS